MIPNNTIVAEVETTMQGEQVQMGFDPGALTHLMGILSEIYTDPAGAVAREYITNALDSHVEAGTTRPVEVTLPSTWQPNLIVRDYGIGMDIDDIRNTYSKYGASSKRGSNLVNGMLGIGSKSAFAYSNAFVVTGIKGGHRVTVSVSRGRDGEGIMTIVENEPTTEPNGVTIMIPVSSATVIVDRVKRVASVLPLGALTVNGEEMSMRGKWRLIKSDTVDPVSGTKILNIWSIPGTNLHYDDTASRIIMGNVAYEPTSRITPNHWGIEAVMVEVDMGDVVFAPSREKLQDVLRTQQAEAFIRKTVESVVVEALVEKIVNAESRSEAFKAYNEHYNVLRTLGRSSLKYKGSDIPLGRTTFANSNSDQVVVRTFRPFGYGRRKAGNETMLWLQEVLNYKMLVKDAPDTSLTASMRAKIEQYATKQGLSGSQDIIALFPSRVPLDNVWLEGKTIVDWADIAAEVLPRVPRQPSGEGVKTKGKHYVLKADGGQVLRPVKDTEKVYYLSKSHLKDWNLRQFGIVNAEDWYSLLMQKAVKVLPSGSTLVDVALNRREKFIRDYPNAVELTQTSLHGMLVKHIEAGLTETDIKVWAYREAFNGLNNWPKMYGLLPDEDPDKALSLIGEAATTSQTANALNSLPDTSAVKKRSEEVLAEAKEVADRIISRYPLLNMHFYYSNLPSSAVRVYLAADFNK